MMPPPSKDQFAGCMLGLALGDALGAPFEGGVVERLVWRFMGKTGAGLIRWTDDTQMSLDLAESLLGRGELDADDVATRFSASYRWSRGYGPGTAKLLKRIRRGKSWREVQRSVFPSGSFGNGGAMRAPVVGLAYAARAGRLVDAARESAAITHAHPIGMAGAVLIAVATATALSSREALEILEAATARCDDDAFTAQLELARAWLTSGTRPSAREVRSRLGTGMVASRSCATALYLALRFLDAEFRELIDFATACGGDADTIGAMAGAIWGAAHGAARLPYDALRVLEDHDRIRDTAHALHAAFAFAAPLPRPRAV